MTRIGYCSALVVPICVAALVAAAPPAVSAADAPPQLVSVALSRESITVAPTGVELLTVSVRLTDDVGVVEVGDATGDRFPTLTFGNPRVSVRLQLGTGTARDGVWTGVAPVTSNWGASEQPTWVSAIDTANNVLGVDPRTVVDTPAVRVQSSDQPVLTLTITPDPVLPRNAVTRTVRAVHRATGRPWPGLRIVVAADNACGADTRTGANATTDAGGVFRQTLPAGTIWDIVQCAWVPAANVPGQYDTRIGTVTARARYRYLVTAAPAAASVVAGTNVNVTGNVTPAEEGKPVHLQRRSGTRWRTVGTALTRASSRYTLVATPPGVGTWTYRVRVTDGENRVGNTSPTFTIRAT